MKKLIILPVIALLTFAIGVALHALRKSSPHKSNEIAAPADQRLREAPTWLLLPPLPPPPLPPSLEELGEKENSDLSIVVATGESNGSVVIRHLKLHKNPPTLAELDLAESINGQAVSLNFPDNSAQYRILQRYRTSMTVSAEGPHLDLVDWRHFDSPWIELKSIGPKRFRMLASDEMEETTFPPTTKSEIVTEVRRRMEKEWPEIVELVKSCRGPNDGACIVALSSIYIRIQKQVGGSWTDLGSVEFQIPMGC